MIETISAGNIRNLVKDDILYRYVPQLSSLRAAFHKKRCCGKSVMTHHDTRKAASALLRIVKNDINAQTGLLKYMQFRKRCDSIIISAMVAGRYETFEINNEKTS